MWGRLRFQRILNYGIVIEIFSAGGRYDKTCSSKISLLRPLEDKQERIFKPNNDSTMKMQIRNDWCWLGLGWWQRGLSEGMLEFRPHSKKQNQENLVTVNYGERKQRSQGYLLDFWTEKQEMRDGGDLKQKWTYWAWGVHEIFLYFFILYFYLM